VLGIFNYLTGFNPYIVDLPEYGRCIEYMNLLIKCVYGNIIKYKWMPIDGPILAYYEGKLNYTLTIDVSK
jgi:hypothetical protein